MTERLGFMGGLKLTLSRLGSATSKVLENLEKTDRELNEKMKKVTNSI